MTDASRGFFDFESSNLSVGVRAISKDLKDDTDDTDYDALNNETFGEDGSGTDWESVHEKLTSELETRSFDDENSELSERVASCILDDEGEENICTQQPSQTPLSSSSDSGVWWTDNQSQISKVEHSTGNNISTPILGGLWGASRPGSSPFSLVNGNNVSLPPKPPQIMTVEELEKKMRLEAESKNLKNHILTSRNTEFEYGEREPSNSNAVMNPIPNGKFIRNRPPNHPTVPLNPRGRYSHHKAMPENYHGPHRPHPVYPPDMMTAPQHRSCAHQVRARHLGPGPMYPRHMHDQFMRHIGAVPRRRLDMPDQPGNNQYMLYNHQQQGGFRRPGPLVHDEYAGLMTPQEKHWLASIQMMQLTTNQPYQDDYYYMMNHQRQQGNCGRKMNSHGPKTTTAANNQAPYSPQQFSNALGKLQTLSVTAPRKMIERVLVEKNIENNTKPEKKSKQILMEIEELYNTVLLMEEANISGAKGVKAAFELLAIQGKINNTLVVENKLASVMSIRKGKKVVLRLLPLLVDPMPIISKLLENLMPISRKDAEQTLLSFLPYIRRSLAGHTLKMLVNLVKNYDASYLLCNKFTISVTANFVERAEQTVKEAEKDVVADWTSFLLRLAQSTDNWGDTERPVVGVDKATLTRHLTLIQKLASEEQVTWLINALSILQTKVTTTVPTDNKI